MSQVTDHEPISESPEEGEPSLVGLVISVLIIAGCVIFGLLDYGFPGSRWTLPFLMFQVAVVSVVIWQACDPFADAAQWIGEAFRLPGSVRGATLDAIASSMPELFSGIFFVVLAVAAIPDGDTAAQIAAGAEGFGSTIATCAGSAVYNMILIPAFCALVISATRKNRPTIDVEPEVITRDGVWFVCCNALLILFLFQNTMMWWMGALFIGIYTLYVVQLSRDAGKYQRQVDAIRGRLAEQQADASVESIRLALAGEGMSVSAEAVAKARGELSGDTSESEMENATAGLFFGYVKLRLNQTTAWLIIAAATLVAAIACYFLVEATRSTATHLGVPAFFVAVILAAAASSVPDTFLAIAAARRGDDSGAVSNAFGSNIFDICICLSIPLFVNSYLTGWAPVSLLQDGKPIPGLVGLRILLVVLTILTLAVMWHNKQLTRNKAIVLCGMYLVFVAYAVLGSLGILAI
jgi:Ca2+/Na+ antiporter